MRISEILVLYGGPIDVISKLAHKFWILAFKILWVFWRKREKPNQIYIIAPEISDGDLAELTRRASFYVPILNAGNVVKKMDVSLSILLSPVPVLIFGPRKKLLNWFLLRRPGTFDVDFRTNPSDGWAWTGLSCYVRAEQIDFSNAHKHFSERITTLKQESRTKCYIFGTGPSLEAALDHRWNDGYRIVCNTIVRDPFLWDYLDPDFIVAGDAIYHFGHTEFARAFRRDLCARLQNSKTLFVYPAQFHAIVEKELAGLEAHLIPVPSGWRRTINNDLTRSFQLPSLGNVLGLLLLPLACTLSKNIYLWGFDGRAPNDKMFWSNSSKHTYAEHLDELKKAHPRFFEYYVPISDPNKYVRNYQGDQLEVALQLAERNGWTFEMMHRSWTPVLQKRYRGDK